MEVRLEQALWNPGWVRRRMNKWFLALGHRAPYPRLAGRQAWRAADAEVLKVLQEAWWPERVNTGTVDTRTVDMLSAVPFPRRK